MGCAQSKTEDVPITTTPKAEVASTETDPVTVDKLDVEEVNADKSEPLVEEMEPTAEESVTPAEESVTPAEETTPPTEPEAEAEAETTTEATKELYKITGHEIDEAGVVFYIIESETSFKKRFSDFKALVVALGTPKHLPALPASGLGAKLRGKHNPKLIHERETQLSIVLNAIANDNELAEKDAFLKFVEC